MSGSPAQAATWLAAIADEPCCDISTTGRRTGLPHEIEIWFGVADATIYVISGNGPTADWYRNMLAEPRVAVRCQGTTMAGVARRVESDDERRRVGDLMGAKYVWGGDPDIGLTYDAWCYDVPAIAIDLDAG